MKKILGLILELNPPHNGHKYFIEEAKKIVNPDVTVAVISTNFSMRGDIMVLNKFQRTQIAIKLGVDIVLELPTIFSLNSADLFCYNAISILNSISVTDICFGVELDNLDKLNKMVKIIDSSEYNQSIKSFLDSGISYQASSFKAFSSLINDKDLINNFTLPNNTLAIQYLRSIKQIDNNINVHIIKRIDNNYYDEKVSCSSIASATSLRCLLEENRPINEFIPINDYNFINIKASYNNLFNILKYKFLVQDINKIASTFGVSEGIENRFFQLIDMADNYNDLVKIVQTKRYSLNKIKRLIIHILLETNIGIGNKANDEYIRILGMNENGKKYIASLDREVKKKIITTIKHHLDNEILQFELKSTRFYGILVNSKNLFLEEFKLPIIEGENE